MLLYQVVIRRLINFDIAMSSSPLSFESYQVDPTFPPNKELSWPYPSDHDGMVLTNNSIRGELSCLKQALDSMVHRETFLDWEILAIQRMWNSHFTHMNDVRCKEDEKVKPILTKRFRMPESVSHEIYLCFVFGFDGHTSNHPPNSLLLITASFLNTLPS